jgi:hypothetical protein
MEFPKTDVKKTQESGDGSSTLKTVVKVAGMATAGSAAIAFLVAAAVAPNTGILP